MPAEAKEKNVQRLIIIKKNIVMKKNIVIRFASAGFICFVLLLGSCKKDRVPQDDFQDMDSFYNQHKEEEQEFIIDSTGSCPVIARKGTKFCVSADMFLNGSGAGINYPFFLRVVELYSMKDMILWRLPSISSGTILETSAEIRTRTLKGTDELVLKPGRAYYMELDTMPVLNNNMEAFYGYNSGSIVDWTNNLSSIISGFVDTLSAVSVNPYFYSLSVARMGWISAARQHVSANPNTRVSLTAQGNNTQNIEVFIIFNGFKGLMKVNNLVSDLVPVGSQVTLIAFAKNQNNDFLLYQQAFVVSANQQITLNFQTISESDLLNRLESL